MENMNRRDRQYKDATLGAFIGWIGILLFCLIAVLFSCGVTKTTTHNCELMEQGQKCLPDHSCCK